MRFKGEQALFLALGFFALLGSLSGCAEQEPTDEKLQEERVLMLIDDRQYDAAIGLVEPRVSRGDSLELRPLLALAHFGKAGFEPLQIAQKVLGVQAGTIEIGCRKDALSSLEGEGIGCILFRLAQALPEADHSSMVGARQLLNAHYPNIQTTPMHFNLVLASVAFGSVIKRAWRWAEWAAARSPEKITEELPSEMIRPEAQALWKDLLEGQQRSRNIPKAIVKLMTGSMASRAFFMGETQELSFAADTMIPALAQALYRQSTLELQEVLFRTKQTWPSSSK